MIRAVWLAALGALVLAATPAEARADAELDQCVDAATRAVVAVGAEVREQPTVRFLREGRSETRPVVLDRSECVGVIAMGHRRVHDLDLVLYTDTGVVVAEDTAIDSRPYVRFCGAAGVRLFAEIRMYKGQGEVAAMVIGNAPASLPDLNQTFGECFATSGGTSRSPPDIGPVPPGRSLSAAEEAIERRLSALGYRAGGRVASGTLSEGQRAVHALPLEGGACFALAAVGGETVGDVDLLVRTADGHEIGRDDARTADAVVELCTERPVELAVEVRMFSGRGPYAVHAFRLPLPAVMPDGLEGHARAGFAELEARLSTRGFRPRPIAWGMAVPGRPLSMPVALEAGRCYAISVVGADETAGADLDVVLLDDDGRLVGWDLGRRALPTVWHCPARSETYRALARIYGAWGRYLLVVGEEGGSP